jgi:hypothetical protein
MMTETTRATLEDLKSKLNELVRSLERMGASKRGTYFETSRIRERDNLRRQIARLEGRN